MTEHLGQSDLTPRCVCLRASEWVRVCVYMHVLCVFVLWGIPHYLIVESRKSTMVVSIEACLRWLCVGERRRRRDNQTERVHHVCACVRTCVCDYNVSDNPCHESVGRGLGHSASYYSVCLYLSIFFPLSTSSFCITAVVPLSVFCPLRFLLSPLFYCLSLSLSLSVYLFFIPQLSLEGLKRSKKCGNVCSLPLQSSTIPFTLSCVFLIFFHISSSLLQVPLRVIFNVKLIYLPILPLSFFTLCTLKRVLKFQRGLKGLRERTPWTMSLMSSYRGGQRHTRNGNNPVHARDDKVHFFLFCVCVYVWLTSCFLLS